MPVCWHNSSDFRLQKLAWQSSYLGYGNFFSMNKMLPELETPLT